MWHASLNVGWHLMLIKALCCARIYTGSLTFDCRIQSILSFVIPTYAHRRIRLPVESVFHPHACDGVLTLQLVAWIALKCHTVAGLLAVPVSRAVHRDSGVITGRRCGGCKYINRHSYSVGITDKGSWPEKCTAAFIIYTANINTEYVLLWNNVQNNITLIKSFVFRRAVHRSCSWSRVQLEGKIQEKDI